jgi:archaeosortase B (VPXXXP-CTERM-specific)
VRSAPSVEARIVSQDDPVEQPTDGGEPALRRPARSGARIGAFLSVPTYRFALVFFAFLVGISMIYPALKIRLAPSIAALEFFTAEVVYRLMSCFSSEVKLENGNIVFFGPFPVKIIDECSGIYEALLLGAALLAYPTAWSKIALGFAIGFPLIYAMNIARIALLLAGGRYFPYSFEFLHLYFWQGTMILMVASTWLIWILWVVRDDGGQKSPSGRSNV